MSSSHIFYMPVLILIGFFAGFFVGKDVAQKEAKEAKKRLLRQAKRAKPSAPQGAEDA